MLDTTPNFELPLPDVQTKLTPNLRALAERLDIVMTAFSLGALTYRGVWDATNPPAGGNPTLADGVGDKGDFYVVSAAGIQDLGSGPIDFSPADWVVYNGSIWQKADHTDVVTSVFGRQGAVSAALGDYLASLILNDSAVAGTTVKDALDALQNLLTVTSEPTGFPNRTDSVLSFLDGNRTLTISPTGASFDYYIKGVKYTVPAKSKQISTAEGLHYLYLDTGGLLQETTVFTSALFKDYAIVAIVYWDNSATAHLYLGDERHGFMPWETHFEFHQCFGTRFLSGLALNTILADQSGALDTHAECGVDSGSILDEDLVAIIAAKVAPAQIPVYYLTGTGDWNADTATNFPVKRFGPVSRLAWNQFIAGSWQQTEVGNNDFVLAHLFATNDYTAGRSIIAIQGQATYGNKPAAEIGAETEINSLITSGLPLAEFKPIATIIYQTSSGYGNTVQARIRTTSTGGDYVDWRQSDLSPATSPTNHSLLSGRSDPNSHPASAVNPDTTNFNGLLSAADDTTQKALDTLDDGAASTSHKDTHKSGGSDAFVPADLIDGIVRRLRESGGPTDLLVGAIADGQFLKRSGAAIVGQAIVSGDLPTLSVRRTASINISAWAAWQNMLFDFQDIENDPSVLEWTPGNGDRLYAKEDGMYWVFFSSTWEAIAAGSIYHHVHCRARVNDTTVIPGSYIASSPYYSASTVEQDKGNPAHGFPVYLTAGQYVSVQFAVSGQAATVTSWLYPPRCSIFKMRGSQGPQGIPGAGSSVVVEDEGVSIPNTPHTNLNIKGTIAQALDAGAGVADFQIGDTGYASVEGQSTNATAVFAQKTRLSFTPKITGDYVVGYSAAISGGDTERFVKYRLQQDDSTDLVNRDIEIPKNLNAPTRFVEISGFAKVTLTAGTPYTFDLDYAEADSQPVATAYIKEARLKIEKF